MAIIYSYPLATPLISDFILGTHDVNQVDGKARNVTVNFTVSSLLNLIATSTGAQTLQQVTNLGATTTNAVTFNGSIAVLGTLKDSFGNVGTIGQVLSSSVIGTRWITNAFGGVTSVTTTDGTFINLTPNTATTGAVTVTADLNATGTASATTFLRGDNKWQ